MIRLKDIRMRPKLIGLMLLVSLAPLVLVAWWSSQLATEALMEQASRQLESVREIKRTQLERFFEESEDAMTVLVDTVQVLQEAAYEKLANVQANKKARVETLFDKMRGDIRSLTKSKDVREVYDVLKQYHIRMNIGANEAFKATRLY